MHNAKIIAKKETIKGRVVSYTDNCLEGFLTLILIHPFPFNQKLWKDQVDYLIQGCEYPDVKYRVITYDIAGFGESEHGNRKFTLDQWVDDLRLLMDHLNIYKAVIGGMSMGGYIALRFAEMFSNRLLGLILCDTKAIADTEEQREGRYDTIKRIDREGLDKYAENLVSSLLITETVKTYTNKVTDLVNIIKANSYQGITGGLYAMAERRDMSSDLRKIKVPVLVLVGESDEITTVDDAKSLYTNIPDAELHIIPEAAHLSNIDNPDIFNKILFNYMEKLYNGLMKSEFEEEIPVQELL